MAFLIRGGKLREREARKKEGDGESAIVVKHSSVSPLPLFMLHKNDSNSHKEDYSEN